MKRPDVTSRERTSCQSAVVPVSVVVQLVVPCTSETDEVDAADDGGDVGGDVVEAMASTSDWVSVDAVPKPPRTPVLSVELPGETTSRLVPSSSICAWTSALAPLTEADGEHHGGDADQDAEHRERRAQAVGADGVGRGPEGVSATSCRHRRCRRASGVQTRPSRTSIDAAGAGRRRRVRG